MNSNHVLLRVGVAGVVAIVTILSPVESAAQNAFLQDPSVRAAGMGRATTALFWGVDGDDWRNPALLSYREGLLFTRGRTQLVPDLAGDVYFTTNRLSLGAWGVGLSLEGKPWDALGGRMVDYGETQAVDQEGTLLGTFESYDDVNAWGVGVNCLQFLDTGFALAGVDLGSLHRFADVALGTRWNEADVFLAPAWAMAPFGMPEARTDAKRATAAIWLA